MAGAQKFAAIAIADINQQVALQRAACKKSVVYVLTVKTRHRAGIQPQRPAGDDQIGRLHGTVAKRCFFGKLWAGGKPTAGIAVRKQLW